jgi:predicted Zn-dependent protease with MMP-like domain
MLSKPQRQLFDDLLDQIVGELPEHLLRKLEEVPVIVEDIPSALMLDQLGLDGDRTLLCGLHWGISLPARSVEHSAVMPDRIWLFRQPIMQVAGWHAESGGPADRTFALSNQIRITLLHEIGHHFGLDEDDLTELGYG